MARPQAVSNDTKIMPIALEAEQALLGAILLDNKALEVVEHILKPEHFYEHIHTRIYEAVTTLAAQGRVANPATLQGVLTDIDLGGLTMGQYIARLLSNASSVTLAPEYARTILSTWTRRKMISIAEQMMAQAYDAPIDKPVELLLSEAEVAITDLSTEGVEACSKSSGELAAGTVAKLDKAFTTGKAIGIECGIPEVQELIGPMMPGDLIVVGGGTSHGKAQPLSSLVHTPNGFVTIGSLRIGDELSSVDGSPSHVTGIFPQGTKEVYEITFIDGRKVQCCEEHLWKVKFSRWKEERVVNTAEIIRIMGMKNGKGRLSVPLPSPVECRAFDLSFDPYAIGALIGDGGLAGGTPRISTTDMPVLSAVLNAFPALRAAKSGKCDYRLSSRGRNPLTPVLDELNLRCLSKDKALAPQLMLMPATQRLALLQGMMDTDGYIDRGTGAPVFCTSSEALAHDVQRLVWSLGGVAKVTSRIPTYTYRGQKKTGLRAYRVYVRMPCPKSLFRLDRRRERAAEVNRQNRELRLVITSVEKIGREECQCISVSHPERLYLTDGFVVTHNTALSQQMAMNVAKAGKTALIFSIEMEPEHFNERYLANEAGVASEAIENAYLNAAERDRVREAAARLAELPLHIVGLQDLTVPMMLAEARRLKRKHGLSLILIDHLQFITPVQRFRSDAEGIASNVRLVKQMAKRLGVPVLLLSHLNREYAKEDRKPTVSDLYGSGAIEKDADIVMFVHREERALAAKEPSPSSSGYQKWWDAFKAAEGKAEVILGKRRRGKGYGKRIMRFDGKTTTFSPISDPGTLL